MSDVDLPEDGVPPVHETLNRALDTWGDEAQIEMAIEECGELITALSRLRRGRNTEEDVIEEIADVEIITDQLALMFGDDEVVEARRKGLWRLAKRLDAYEEVDVE